LPSGDGFGNYFPTESERLRGRAIRCALLYALAPYWLYEDKPHYAPMGYLAHLWMNLVYSWRWVTGQQTEADLRFEREVNSEATQ